MRKYIRPINLAKILLVLAPATIAWTWATTSLELGPESRLWVRGTSTMRAFECKSSAVEARIESKSADAVTAVLAGEKAVGSVEVTVPAEKLDCRNGTMNEHMLKALKAKEHPVIGFTLSDYELARAEQGQSVQLTGELSLGGARKSVVINATATEGPNGTLRVTGTHELRMTEFGLKPPRLMLGTIRVNEGVTVGFDLILKN